MHVVTIQYTQLWLTHKIILQYACSVNITCISLCLGSSNISCLFSSSSRWGRDLLKCSTTFFEWLIAFWTACTSNAFWTERFSVWPAHGRRILSRSSSTAFTTLLPLSVVKAVTSLSASMHHLQSESMIAPDRCEWSCVPGGWWHWRELLVCFISNSEVTMCGKWKIALSRLWCLW